MKLNVEKELAALRQMSVNELRSRYAEIFGEPTNARHKDWLVKRVIWRMQAQAEGDLTERARRRAEELANDADLRCRPPKTKAEMPPASDVAETPQLRTNRDPRLPIKATTLVRVYKGNTLQVKVLPNGFEYEGTRYRSLSAVAKKITGSHCNGYLFFGLAKEGSDQ
jgi:hypothetical protein